MVTSTVWPEVKKKKRWYLHFKKCPLKRQLKSLKSWLIITFTFPRKAWFRNSVRLTNTRPFFNVYILVDHE